MTNTKDRRSPPVLNVVVWAVGMAFAALMVFAHRQQPLMAGALGATIVVATWLSAIDLAVHRLPNPIVGGLTVAVVLMVLVGGVAAGDPGRSSRAIGFGIAAFTLFLVLNLMGGMGMGDVKYAFPVVTTLGWFGWTAIATAALVTAATGALAAGAALALGRGSHYRLPYGPFMSAGLVAGLLRVAAW